MAKIVILGAGIAGHTAATLLRRRLKNAHEVVVVSPNSQWNWIPSNIWVGVGVMKQEEVLFPLAPVYKRQKITYVQAKAVAIHPEGDSNDAQSYVVVEHTSPSRTGETERISYDYLVNATGPKLNFEATEGLGPGKNSLSVCAASHAHEAAEHLKIAIGKMKQGTPQTFVVGTGHGTCTCEGAAFEYVFNLEHEIAKNKVRDLATIIFLTNEYELGDFGMAGMFIERGGYVVPSQLFAESLFTERGIRWIKRAHVQRVLPNRLDYETIDGTEGSLDFDFAMLLPPFKGVELLAFDRLGKPITESLFAPNHFMKVDANYTQKPYEQWFPEDWPSTYQNPVYRNVFAAGIAFAPPHPISKPFTSPKGTPIFAAPPRTGMTAGIMGRSVALSIADMVEGKSDTPAHPTPFAKMGAACVASAGTGFFKGSAASITMFPIVPDYKKYPYGRDLNYTTGEIGLAGHWIKRILHHMFIYKAKCRPGWFVIPE
jgi:sulfide:quinone oxidoreductase